MENGELTYEGHDHFSVAERLFRINDQLKYLITDVEKFSEKEMTKKVIAKTSHPVARLEYICRGGKELTSKQAILACVQDTQNFLNEEHEIGMGRNKKFQPRNNNNSHNSNKLSGNSNRSGKSALTTPETEERRIMRSTVPKHSKHLP